MLGVCCVCIRRRKNNINIFKHKILHVARHNMRFRCCLAHIRVPGKLWIEKWARASVFWCEECSKRGRHRHKQRLVVHWAAHRITRWKEWEVIKKPTTFACSVREEVSLMIYCDWDLNFIECLNYIFFSFSFVSRSLCFSHLPSHHRILFMNVSWLKFRIKFVAPKREY